MKSLKYLIILFISTVQYLSAQTAENHWFWQYPKPQGNTLRDIYLFDSTTVIAVGDIGTVIKTTDGGITWDVKYNSDEAALWPKVIFQDRYKGWTVWKGNIYKTEDGGRKWNIIYTDTSSVFCCIYFIDNEHGWVCGNNGLVLKTIDGGKIWTNLGLGYDISPVKVYFASPDTGWIFVSGFSAAFFIETTDGGVTWAKKAIEPNVWGIQDICFLDDKNWFIVALGVFAKTRDRGKTWDVQNLEQKYPNSYSVFFVDSSTGWIAGGNGSHYGYILKTTDGGKLWNINGIDLKADELFRIRFTNTNSDKWVGWAVGENGIIYKTTNAGKNWMAQREKQFYLRSVYFVDENSGWVVGDSGLILHTEDGGTNWVKKNQNDSLLFNYVFAIDKENVFAVGSLLNLNHIPNTTKNAILLSSTNEGQTWQTKIFDSLFSFNSIFFINDSTGWIAAGLQILKTTNRGSTWKNIANYPNIPTRNLQFINKDVGWGDGYNISKTTDGGGNWKSVCFDSTFTVNSFNFINSNIGWAAGVGYNPVTYYWDKYIYKTTDGGDSWMLCPIVPTSVYYSIYFFDENIGWAGGGYTYNPSTIIKTSDGGETWSIQDSPSTDAISSIYFISENVGWAIGAGIFKTIDGGGIVSVKDKKEKELLPKQIELYQNYPNPFNPSTVISYKLSVNSNVVLKVYNILGKEVKTLVNEEKKPGIYKVQFDALKLSSGIYFYRLQTEKFSEAKKMILLR